MGRLTRLRKLRKLEGRAEASHAAIVALAERQRERTFEAALALLSDADMGALSEIVAMAIAKLDGSSASTDLYEYAADEHDVRALRAFERALSDVRASGAIARN